MLGVAPPQLPVAPNAVGHALLTLPRMRADLCSNLSIGYAMRVVLELEFSLMSQVR